MRSPTRPSGLAVAALLLLAAPALLEAQDPISLSHFEDWRSWPVYEAGELPIDNAALATQRTIFDFANPTGAVDPMVMDVFADVYHRGRPAVWVQWTSGGRAGDTEGTSVLDAILLDRETFRVAFRIQGVPGPRAWAGPYAVTQHHPGRVARIGIADDGTVTTDELAHEVDPFDFATMQYLFPFIGLEEGKSFRLMNVGAAGNLEPRDVGVRVIGRTSIEDARGVAHDVWEVQLLTNTEGGLVSFYVTETAPFFHGWDFRRVADGRTLTSLRLRDHGVL